MMEAALSLMQMAKTSVKLAQLDAAKLPYISLCTDPTTGGTTASYAMLGDINIAEPGALIGFAGPRVVKDTTGQDLPEGFQTAEFVKEHGFLDFKQYGGSETNTGSTEGQIALFTYRINHLTEHLKKNHKDFNTERSLIRLVGKRRSLLDYLKANDIEKYRSLIKDLGIRK